IAILISSGCYALFALKSLTQLITVYAWLRIATTLMTVLAAKKLRQTQPDLPRPFHIPWGRMGLVYVVGAPMVMAGVALVGSDRFALHWGPVAILLGPAAYLVVRKVRARQRKGPGVAAAQTWRRRRKRDAIKRDVIRIAADDTSNFASQVGSDSNPVSRVPHRIVHAVALSRMRHDVEGEVESSSPDEFNIDLAQLRIHVDHATLQNLGALAHGGFVLREKCGAATK